METELLEGDDLEEIRVSSLPMRDGNQFQIGAKGFVQLAVSSLPMRDGNGLVHALIAGDDERFEPTYEGWKHGPRRSNSS